VSASPAQRPVTQTTFLGVAKEARADERGRRVRIIDEDGTLVDVCDAAQVEKKYRAAKNAEIICANNGRIVAVRLTNQADDRGHMGERHGRSTVTTQRLRNAFDECIGGDQNLKHKGENDGRANPAWDQRWPLMVAVTSFRK
jgi:hypothetical protein